jgi:chemotaxis protein MotA
MAAFLGLFIIFASVLGGFMMHGGHPALLWQVSEFIIIGGAGLGAMVASTSPKAVLHTFKEVGALAKGNPYTKDTYTELLLVLFEFFDLESKQGKMALDAHIEDPQNSSIFERYPFFHKHQHAISFLTDTIKVLNSGTIDPNDMDVALEMDLEQYQEEANHGAHSLQTTGEAMPAFGIVAAVLGVVITMQKVGGDAATIGKSIAAALVGTFLGVLSAYGFLMPLSQAVGAVAKSEVAYLNCIKAAILSYMRKDSPMTCVEFARRSIEPAHRPSFTEMEMKIREIKRGGAAAP